MRDQATDIKWTNAEPPVAAVTGDTPFVSEILDVAGFDAATFLWLTGTLTDVAHTYTLLIEEGDASNLSDATAVADADLVGTEASGAPLLTSDNKAGKIGYIGKKRYVRATLTPANNTGDIYFAAGWLQGFARKAPLSTQIV